MPEVVLKFCERIAPDVKEGWSREGLDEEVEVALEDAERFIELRGDGELIGVVYSQVRTRSHLILRQNDLPSSAASPIVVQWTLVT